MSDKPDVLFAPPDGGDEYKPDASDFDRVASQQPLKYDKIPSYLFDEIAPNVSPLKLWAGWRVGDDGVLRIARENMPEIIVYTWDGEPNRRRLMTDGSFARKVCELCQIPEDDWELIDLVFAAKLTGTLDSY